MKNLSKILFLFGIIVFVVFGCENDDNDNIKGGECDYKVISGKAVIISISNAPSTSNNCPNDPQEIKFNFTPDNSENINNYLFPNWKDTCNFITIHAGKNPSKNWAERNNIHINDELKCYRNEIIQGTCTLVVFKFPDLDLDPEDYCE